MKTCVQCWVAKDETDYYIHASNGRRDGTCKVCRNRYHADRVSTPCETCGQPSQGKRCRGCYAKTQPKNYQCSMDGCTGKRHCKGYCSKHYYTEYQRDKGKRHTYQCAVCLNPYETCRPARGSHPVCGGTCHAYYIMWTAGGNTTSRQGQCDVCGTECTLIGTQSVCSKRECWNLHGDVTRRQAQARRAHRIRTNGDYEAVKRTDIFKRDRYRCHICKQQTDQTATYPHPRYPTLDHLVPIARGGTHTAANLSTACLRCNVLKGTSSTGEQLALIG